MCLPSFWHLILHSCPLHQQVHILQEKIKMHWDNRIYHLLTEFEGRTVSYGLSSRLGHKRGSVTYSTNQENEVSKIFIISVLKVVILSSQERFLLKLMFSSRKGF